MMTSIELAREQMLGQQIRAWEVLDERVIAAMRSVPREQFVPEAYQDLAFADAPIPLAHGEEMMAPKIEGRMLQALALSPEDSVLEIGTGSGFITACLASLAGSVLSLDIHDDFVIAAGPRLAALGKTAARLQTADVFSFRPSETFDAIALTGSLPQFDERFVDWLNPGGRLFCIVGQAPVMDARLIQKTATGEWMEESLFETVVPPLRNALRPPRFQF
ncbi:MAG: protein-L-isoaspartate O-methyltransferase [Gammaproteobacteria bacterium]|nr:protein-L-isoaspartate O-methyltransferase [Gammaproteobacteria bacterium]